MDLPCSMALRSTQEDAWRCNWLRREMGRPGTGQNSIALHFLIQTAAHRTNQDAQAASNTSQANIRNCSFNWRSLHQSSRHTPGRACLHPSPALHDAQQRLLCCVSIEAVVAHQKDHASVVGAAPPRPPAHLDVLPAADPPADHCLVMVEWTAGTAGGHTAHLNVLLAAHPRMAAI